MKKVKILIGSPRKKGNSVSMAGMLTSLLDETNYLIENIYLYDYQINACTDCRVCKKGDMVCKVNDGMQDLYPVIEDTDILIFATPIYWFGPSAKTKLLIDRLRPYFANKKLNGKQGALLLPAGSGPGDCDLTIEQFRRTFMALGIRFLGAVTTTAFDIGDAVKDIYLEGSVKQLIERIEQV